MIVAVVGASGGVGSATVKAALAAGLHVRAFARSREKLNAALGESVIDQLDAHVLGDISDPVALDALLSSNAEGNVPEVVLSCLGTPSGAKPCVRDGTLSLIQAIRRRTGGNSSRGKARLVIISSIGVGDSVAQGLSMDCFFIRCVKPVCLARVFADLDRAEEACWLESLEEDGVRCVAVRPPQLKDETGVGIEAVRLVASTELKPARRAAIARADVASAMVRLVDPSVFPAWVGKGVTVVAPNELRA